MTSIAEFLEYLHSLEIQLSVEKNSDGEIAHLRCSAPAGTLTAQLKQQLLDRKAELLTFLQNTDHPFKSLSSAIEPSTQKAVFPLSFAQQRLWFLYQLAPDSAFYNVPLAIRLQGNLNDQALERSFHEIVHRHATLRTTFKTLSAKAVQIIEPEVKISIPIVDLRSIPVEQRETITQQLATTEAQRSFNLSSDLPLRVTLLRFDAQESILLLVLHHIVADGWSLGVLVRELAYCYANLLEDKPIDLPPLPIQYTDFSQWQRERLQGKRLDQQLNYWRKQLQNLPILNLSSDRPRPALQTYRGETYPIHCSLELTQALETLCQQENVSLFMLLLAAFQTLLFRYTGQNDMAIGSPIANRHHSEVEGLIGFFVNTVVLRANLSGNLSFRELLQQVREVALEAYAHQELPFEKLVEELEPDRDLSRNPLFQVAFALQNAPMQPLKLPGITLQPIPLQTGSTRFDLELHLWEPSHGLQSVWQSEAGLGGFIAYSTDLFDRTTIARLVTHFQTLLASVVADPNTHLSDLSLLTQVEQQQLLVEWNHTQVESPDRCFHHLFEAWVKQFPQAIALVSEQGSLTYAELNQKADRLAAVLHQMGVSLNELVGVYVDRSPEWIISILAILKAGGAYVPLDPQLPGDRLHFMLEDTKVKVVLTQSWLIEKLSCPKVNLLCLDQPLPIATTQNSTVQSIKPDHLAYLIYTSGSTGLPKGVLLTHRGLCNVVEAQRQVFCLQNHRVSQLSSLSFDASIFEIVMALGSGGTLYLPPRSAQLPGNELLHFLQHHDITHALITPAVLSVLPFAKLPTLQTLITGGEACSSAVIDRWAADRHFFNAYGPTETTIWATITQLYSGDQPSNIGRPIANTQVYILDDALNPTPIGVPGEIYIAGIGLAKGYLNRSELEAERFITPAHSLLPPRLYRTGDRARYRTDGSIEFLGRIDTQIKVRGFRVELGEIEATVRQHSAVEEAIVVTSGESYHLQLIAYFKLRPQPIEQSLQIQQIQHWQTLYHQTYQPTLNCPSNFNITGWNSSYNGQPIPIEQMQEWVSDRVQQILALNPQRVLEIGCGTGLLLFQIAPHCQTYWGTDFSEASLTTIQTQLGKHSLSQVRLFKRLADNFEGIEPASFDVVILNSVIQYFPSTDYLLQVLDGAIQATAPDGVIFLGDVRSFPLLTTFHTWAQFCQADSTLDRKQLRQQVERSRFEDPELTIDPTFFTTLRDRFPRIQRVQIRLSRGRSHNEMTQFRYNVLLHLAETPRSPFHLQWIDWQQTLVTVNEIDTELRNNQPPFLGITGVCNSRLSRAIQTTAWSLSHAEPKTVGRLREILSNSPQQGIDPQAWWDLEAVLPYTVEISWSTLTHTGTYDVLLIRQGVTAVVELPITQSSDRLEGKHYANNPLQSFIARQLIPELRQFLGKTLPDYMIPTTFVPLETFPLLPSGKIDRRSLPPVSADRPTTSPVTTSSITTIFRSPTETTLTDLWKDLLRLQQINPDDNFFELGGHSLLATQLASRVRDTFAIEIPLTTIFEFPTIAQLAPQIDTLRQTTLPAQVPPLVRLNRSAYRHLRSASSKRQLQSSSITTQIDTRLTSDQFVQTPLVPLTTGSHPSPFFCIHPMFGVVLPYLELAHHLQRGAKQFPVWSDRSFYGLQSLGLGSNHTPLNRIEAMATYYIQAIQTIQPEGPYFLGGWSFGGLVAYEMAQQLAQSGHAIALLAILDTPAPIREHQPSLGKSLKFLIQTALWSTVPFVFDYGALLINSCRPGNKHSFLQGSSRSLLTRLLPQESRLSLLNESAIAPLFKVVYANAQAIYHYTPKPYPGRITLFKAEEAIDRTAQEHLGWNLLAQDIQLYSVPGNHLSMLKSPHVQTLAQLLQQCVS